MQLRVMEVLGHSNGGHVVPSESRHGNGDPSMAMGYREGNCLCTVPVQAMLAVLLHLLYLPAVACIAQNIYCITFGRGKEAILIALAQVSITFVQ